MICRAVTFTRGRADAPPRPRPALTAAIPATRRPPPSLHPGRPDPDTSYRAPGAAAGVAAAPPDTSPLPGPGVHSEHTHPVTSFEQQPVSAGKEEQRLRSAQSLARWVRRFGTPPVAGPERTYAR